MPTFGNTSEADAGSLGIKKSVMGGGVFVLPVAGRISAITARVRRYVACNYRTYIYSVDGSDKPVNLLAWSEFIVNPLAVGAIGWVQFAIQGPDTPVELAAGRYCLMCVQNTDSSGVSFFASSTSGGIGRVITEAADAYSSPPNPITAATNNNYQYEIYATYEELGPEAYPIGRLKKGFVSGFHCFMSAYLYAKVSNVLPLKLPDGTLF